MSCPNCPGPRVPHRCGRVPSDREKFMSEMRQLQKGNTRYCPPRSVPLPTNNVESWPLARAGERPGNAWINFADSETWEGLMKKEAESDEWVAPAPMAVASSVCPGDWASECGAEAGAGAGPRQTEWDTEGGAEADQDAPTAAASSDADSSSGGSSGSSSSSVGIGPVEAATALEEQSYEAADADAAEQSTADITDHIVAVEEVTGAEERIYSVSAEPECDPQPEPKCWSSPAPVAVAPAPAPVPPAAAPRRARVFAFSCPSCPKCPGPHVPHRCGIAPPSEWEQLVSNWSRKGRKVWGR